MTAPVFIDLLERKLAEQGVEKIVPDGDVLERHARRVIEERLVVDGGPNPRTNGDGLKTGTKLAVESTVARVLAGGPLSMPKPPLGGGRRPAFTGAHQLATIAPGGRCQDAPLANLCDLATEASPFMRGFVPPLTLVDRLVRDSRTALQAASESTVLPEDLADKVRSMFKEKPELSWDAAVTALIADHAA